MITCCSNKTTKMVVVIIVLMRIEMEVKDSDGGMNYEVMRFW